MNKYYIRTYDNGVHTIFAESITQAINQYLTITKRSEFSLKSVVNAAEEGR